MRLTLALVILLLAACGGGGKTDYFEDPPAEAAEALAARGCEAVFACGVIEIECDPDSAMYAPATSLFPDEETCRAALAEDYADSFAGCVELGLTDEQKADVNACYNQSQDCLSTSELMTLAVAACNDQSTATPECMRTSAIMDDCYTCFLDPADPICDGV